MCATCGCSHSTGARMTDVRKNKTLALDGGHAHRERHHELSHHDHHHGEHSRGHTHGHFVNKTDLLPHVTFDLRRFEEAARQVNPRGRLLRVSATRGDGLGAWYDWLRALAGVAPALQG